MNYYLCYQIGSIRFATEITEVKEIFRTGQITTDRELPKNLAGFFDLRGKRVCLFDLPSFLGIPDCKNFEVVITEITQKEIGFKVEKVFGIVTAEELLPYPLIVQVKDYLKGIIWYNKEILQVLSLHKILSGPRLSAIKKYL